MKTIHKYTLKVSDNPQELRVPKGAKLASIGPSPQGDFDVVCLWFIVDKDADNTDRIVKTYRVIGTGHVIGSSEKYIGTSVQIPFAWHVVEVQA